MVQIWGNGYSAEWVTVKLKKRGLLNIRTAPRPLLSSPVKERQNVKGKLLPLWLKLNDAVTMSCVKSIQDMVIESKTLLKMGRQIIISSRVQVPSWFWVRELLLIAVLMDQVPCTPRKEVDHETGKLAEAHRISLSALEVEFPCWRNWRSHWICQGCCGPCQQVEWNVT